tara:strand:+ start:1944 stop:2123 length:180 start_codon:yes stop_codon:yes gene_type:complete
MLIKTIRVKKQITYFIMAKVCAVKLAKNDNHKKTTPHLRSGFVFYLMPAQSIGRQALQA